MSSLGANARLGLYRSQETREMAPADQEQATASGNGRSSATLFGTLYMIIAWRTLFSLMLARTAPDIDCEIVFDPWKWRASNLYRSQARPTEHQGHVDRLTALTRFCHRFGGATRVSQ